MSDPFIASKGTDNIIKGLHFEKGTGQPASKVTAYWDGTLDRFLLEKKDAATGTVETLIWDSDALLRATDNAGNVYVMGGSGGAASDAVTFQGNWNATTNTPALGNAGAGGVQGDYYVVTAPSGTRLDGNTYAVGDWAVNQGATWGKVDNTVTSIGVTTTGTPSRNQVALFNSAGVIRGDPKFTFDGTTMVVNANMNVLGNVTTINSTIVDIKDRVIHLNHSTGANDPVPTLPVGISAHRGSVAGVARDHSVLWWNEPQNQWVFCLNTNQDDQSQGAFQNVRLGALTASSLLLPTGAFAAKVWTCTDGTGVGSWQAGAGGTITGSGTTGTIAKFTSATAMGDSVITESGGLVVIGTGSTSEKLTVYGTVSTRGVTDTRIYSISSNSANTTAGLDIFYDNQGTNGILLEVAKGAGSNLSGISDGDGYLVVSGSSNLYFGTAGGTARTKFDGATWTFMSGAGITIVGGVNIALDTTTGSKLASATNQKLGIWGATPVVQQTTASGAATFVANTSLIANDSATFDGYTIGQIVKILRTIGVLA